MSECGLIVLSKQGLFGGAVTGKLKFYESCVMGKQHRLKKIRYFAICSF